MEDSTKAFNLAKTQRETVSRDKIQKLVVDCTSFKIGKTGQKLEDRFEEYKKDYGDILEIYSSSKETWIDDLEASLVKYFRSAKDYSSKCKNEKSGSPGEMRESDKYYIYIVRKITSEKSKQS